MNTDKDLIVIDKEDVPKSILEYLKDNDLTSNSKDLYLDFVRACSSTEKPSWESWLYLYNTVKRQKFIDRIEKAIEINTLRKEELEEQDDLSPEERGEYKNLLNHINNFNKRYSEMTRDQMNDVNRSLDRSHVKRTENVNLTGNLRDMSAIVAKATAQRDNAMKIVDIDEKQEMKKINK